MGVGFGMTARIIDGSYPIFEEVLSTYSVAAGSSGYTWVPSYVPVANINQPRTNVQLVVSGYITIECNGSTSVGTSVGGTIADLIDLGFDVIPT